MAALKKEKKKMMKKSKSQQLCLDLDQSDREGAVPSISCESVSQSSAYSIRFKELHSAFQCILKTLFFLKICSFTTIINWAETLNSFTVGYQIATKEL